tara:strand:+ start:3420 stop:5492 length:2073 start_codon:yes stop_codon:yes gene_type:complete
MADKPNPKDINDLSDAISKLGKISKSETKNASKNLAHLSDSLTKFAKKMNGKDTSASVQGMDTLGDGVEKLAKVGKKERNNVVRAIDAIGISIKNFSGNRDLGDSAKDLDKYAQSIKKLATVSRKDRKSIVKDITAINKALGNRPSGKMLASNAPSSKLSGEEDKREAQKAKADDKEERKSLFDSLGEKLSLINKSVIANRPDGGSGFFSSLLLGVSALPGLIISGLQGIIPSIGTMLFGSGSLLIGGLKNLLGVGGFLAKGALSLLTSPLGLIAGAGILGAMAGKFLYDNLVGPWIDDYYAREQAGANEASKNVAKEVTVMTEKGREKVFRANKELQSAFDGKEFITQSELAQYAAAKGSSVEALLEEGNVKAATAIQTAQGTSRFNLKEDMSLEELAGAERAEKEREALQEMARGMRRDEVTGETTRLEEGERLKALRKSIIIREAQQLFDMEQQMHALMRKQYGDESAAQDASFTAAGVLDNAEIAWERIAGLAGKSLSQGTPIYGSDVDKMKKAFPLLWEWRGSNVDNSGKKLFLDSVFDNVFYPELQEYYGGKPGAKWNSIGGGPGIMGNQWNSLPGEVPFKMGGLVRGPVRSLLGEAGPEVVLPLNRAPDIIAEVLTKASKNLSGQQVQLQSMMSNLSGGAASKPAPAPNLVTSTVLSNQNNTYPSPSKMVRFRSGIQHKLRMA